MAKNFHSDYVLEKIINRNTVLYNEREGESDKKDLCGALRGAGCSY